jgi:hypothetical protein
MPLPLSIIVFRDANYIILAVASLFCFARIENYVDVYNKRGKIKKVNK